MKEKHYLIAYDISDNKRRNRIVKLLMNYAYRIQYSVFEFSATELVYRRIMDSVNQIIDSEEDSILIYELCESDWAKRIFFGSKKRRRKYLRKKIRNNIEDFVNINEFFMAFVFTKNHLQVLNNV